MACTTGGVHTPPRPLTNSLEIVSTLPPAERRTAENITRQVELLADALNRSNESVARSHQQVRVRPLRRYNCRCTASNPWVWTHALTIQCEALRTKTAAPQVAALEQDVLELEQQAEAREAELAAERRRVHELTEQCRSFQSRSDELADTAEYERARADGLRVVIAERDALQEETLAQRRELDEAEDALAEEREHGRALAERARALGGEVDALEAALAEERERGRGLTEQLSRARAELGEERRRSASLRSTLAEGDEHIAALRSELERLRAALASEQARSAALREGLVERDERSRGLEAQVAAQRQATAEATCAPASHAPSPPPASPAQSCTSPLPAPSPSPYSTCRRALMRVQCACASA